MSATIAFIGADPGGRFAPLAAGLPVSLEPVTGHADLVLLSDPGLLHEATERAGRAVVLLDPEADAAAVLDRPNRLPIVLSEAYAGSPGIADATAALRDLGRPSLVELCLRGPARPRDEALLVLLRVAEAAGLPLDRVHAVTGGPAAFVLDGDAEGGVPLTAVATGSAAEVPAVELTVHVATGAVHVLLPSPDTAAPALVEVLADGGALTLPTRYESALRVTIRELLAGRTPGPDVAEFVRTARLAARIASG